MRRLCDIVGFKIGSIQNRIIENIDEGSFVYTIYSQMDLQDDLIGTKISNSDHKIIHTKDQVQTLHTGDVVFSLISGNAAIVREIHNGYLYTQNYIKLILNEEIDSHFLVYCINENTSIKRQLRVGLQGSMVFKYTLKQLKEIEMPTLPFLEKQRRIGEVYEKQLRLQALRSRVADLESMILLHQLEEEMKNE